MIFEADDGTLMQSRCVLNLEKFGCLNDLVALWWSAWEGLLRCSWLMNNCFRGFQFEVEHSNRFTRLCQQVMTMTECYVLFQHLIEWHPQFHNYMEDIMQGSTGHVYCVRHLCWIDHCFSSSVFTLPMNTNCTKEGHKSPCTLKLSYYLGANASVAIARQEVWKKRIRFYMLTLLSGINRWSAVSICG
jgi:hypothetical protein